MDQLSFASLDYAAKKKHTKRDVFLAEMAAVVPWVALEAVIEPHYPKAGPNGGRRPFPLAVMLRIYCLQQWYNLSDPGAEEVLYDICSMRAFAGLELGRDAIPDETTILNFRHLLERHELTKAVFAAVSELLEARGALLRGGTIVALRPSERSVGPGPVGLGRDGLGRSDTGHGQSGQPLNGTRNGNVMGIMPGLNVWAWAMWVSRRRQGWAPPGRRLARGGWVFS